MKWSIAALVLVFVGGSMAWAERPVTRNNNLQTIVSSGELKATPEMWFYEQALRNYKDPKMMVRANAQYRAEQRLRRLESMKWFGFSNSRPRVSSDPFQSDYAPHWTSNPGYYPSRWNGVGQAGAYLPR